MTLQIIEHKCEPIGSVQVTNGIPVQAFFATSGTYNVSLLGNVVLQITAIGADHTITYSNGTVERFPDGVERNKGFPAGTVLVVG